MIKKICFPLFLIIQFCYGQKNPYASLNHQLSSATADTQKLQILKELADVALYQDMRKALDYGRRRVALSAQTGNKSWQPKFYEMEGRTRASLLIISSQQKEISQQRKEQSLTVGVIALLFVLLVFSMISYRNRSRSNRLLAMKNAENELLLKEIHHRVKNNLEVVHSLLALQSAQIDDPKTREAMQEGQNRVRSIGIVHQKLYQGENPGLIEMKEYFLDLSESILDSFGAEERVTIELAMEKLSVDIDTAVPLGLIVNELLTNSLKYAFPEGQVGKVRIKLEKQTNGILHLEVSDNGVGKSGKVHGTGFGGQLIALLTRQLSGKMREEIKNGTRVFFDFKVEKAA